jgi:site-specific recombinase XerD
MAGRVLKQTRRRSPGHAPAGQRPEQECGNTPRTRNLRLTAIRSFMKYVRYEVPSALDQVRRVRAISNKRTQERLVNHLTREEMKAVLDAPDPGTRTGIRDQAMLYLGFTAGLRVSELVGARAATRQRPGRACQPSGSLHMCCATPVR